MSNVASKKRIIALVGAPQSGKTAIFQALTDIASTNEFEWLELPGAHSLIPKTENDQLVYDTLLGKHNPPPEGICFVLNMRRYREESILLSEVLDVSLPTFVCITRAAVLAQQGLRLQQEKLSKLLGVPVYLFSPENPFSVPLEHILETPKRTDAFHWRPSTALANAYNSLHRNWLTNYVHPPSTRLIEGLRLLSDETAHVEYATHEAYDVLLEILEYGRATLTKSNTDWSNATTLQRFAWFNAIWKQCLIPFNQEEARNISV